LIIKKICMSLLARLAACLSFTACSSGAGLGGHAPLVIVCLQFQKAFIWGDCDQFRFLYQEVSGDLDIQITVDSQDESDIYAKAGLMLRAHLSPEAQTIFVGCQPSGRIETGVRAGKDEKMLARIEPVVQPPCESVDKVIISSCRFRNRNKWNRNKWRVVRETQLSESTQTIYVGFAVCSYDNAMLTTARF
jgi:hypothetical protein